MTTLLRRSACLLMLALAAMGCTANHNTGEATSALVDEGGACTPTTIRLMAGQHYEAGTVEVSNTETDLIIHVTTTDGWSMSEYHAYAGVGPAPTNKAGAPQVGHFPYSGSLDPAATELTLTIPLDDLQIACGDALTVAFHAVVSREGEDGTQRETAWGEGDQPFRRGWGSSFTFESCCEEESGCVMPKFIWRDHTDWWSLSSVTLGGQSYDAAAMYSLLWTPGWGDASIELAHQVIGAELNIANGAVPSAAVQSALVASEAWFLANADADGFLPYVIHQNTQPAHADGVALTQFLKDWNEGRGTLPLCQWW